MTYEHTQTKVLPALLLAMVGVVLVVGGLAVESGGGVLVAGLALSAVALVGYALSSLKATVTADVVHVEFRFGFPRKTIALTDVIRTAAVRNSWWHGWGIRWIPRGQLWNVWGFDAAELSLASGKRFRIGTDDPNGLSTAIGGDSGVDSCWG